MNQEAVVTACRHRWLIDSPNGPVSQGKCMSCGEHGEFRNSMPISGWDREGSKNHRAKQARTKAS